ncbi:MAG: hypothetical protein KDN05_02185 [Verrucomicrobiae bacterium]|nr:hypothetical protein [Verrucomicrobiae bacterium]MCP5533264.1 hypothetical protein [Akkermansiaceae bacterium]
MGWARTLLLGDIGNRLDIADAEASIASLQRTQQAARNALVSREHELAVLKDELGRQKLAIQALTRFLVEKQVISAGELEDFIAVIDAEDGVVDGKMEIDSATRRLSFPRKVIPEGTFRKTEVD